MKSVADTWEAKNIQLRVEAGAAVSLWCGQFQHGADRQAGVLARLLGFPDYNTLLQQWDDEVRRKCEMLAGPNGYAIYKAMLILARKDG